MVGFLSGLLQQMAAQRDRAERAAAAAEERQRLARVVHDGVLQVLALVQRRAPELGPTGVELGRLAGEQEVRLRGLVQQDSREPVGPPRRPRPGPAAHRAADPRGARGGAGDARHCCPPSAPRRCVAAVESCLSNVRHHVGREPEPGCCWRTWPTAGWSRCATRVPGIPEGRLQAVGCGGAAGCAQSIVGRLRDLGGTRDRAFGAGTGHRVGAHGAPRRRRPGTHDDPHRAPLPRPRADPVRRLRGRLGGAVTLWTSGDPAEGPCAPGSPSPR